MAKKKVIKNDPNSTPIGRAFVKNTASGPELVVSLTEKGIKAIAALRKEGYEPEFRFSFDEIK